MDVFKGTESMGEGADRPSEVIYDLIFHLSNKQPSSF